MCALSGLLLFPQADQGALTRGPWQAERGRDALLRMVGAMSQAQAHRGPDDATLHQEGPLTLGHRRLSLIDLSGGRQPLLSEDGAVQVICNGEIYNHRELRALLCGRGHQFRTRSDSEVIVHAYEEWGLEALSRLRGMFALALYDRDKGELLLARDPVGEKPLYYWQGELRGANVDPLLRGLPALAFSSEAKGLLALPCVPRAADPAGLADYLRYRYIAAPRTAFLGISKLPAGCYLRSRVAAPQRYWDLSYRPKLDAAPALIERLVEDALDDAVRSRLSADVPVGALLSGGLDSSLVVALMRRALGTQPLWTFCSGFSDPLLDERAQAAQVAAALGTRHASCLVDAEALTLLPRVLHHLDEPLADPSLLPTFAVAERAARDVKAVLTGDGGDECFAGYDRYRRSRMSDLLRALPRRPHRLLMRAVQVVAPRLPGGARLAPRLLARLTQSERAATVPLPQLFQQAQSALSALEARALLHPALREQALPALEGDRVAALFENADADHYLDRFLYSDLRSYLADGVLVKSDRMTMAHGLEARAPLLDTGLLQLAAALPVRFKREPGQDGKQVLRALGRRLLPPAAQAMILRAPKRGFTPPLSRWLQARAGAVAGVLGRSTLVEAGVLSEEGLAAALAVGGLSDSGAADRRYLLLTLELWHRVVLLGERPVLGAGLGAGLEVAA